MVDVPLRVDLLGMFERTRAVGSMTLRSKPRSGSAAKREESRSVWMRFASRRAEAPARVRET